MTWDRDEVIRQRQEKQFPSRPEPTEDEILFYLKKQAYLVSVYCGYLQEYGFSREESVALAQYLKF